MSDTLKTHFPKAHTAETLSDRAPISRPQTVVFTNEYNDLLEKVKVLESTNKKLETSNKKLWIDLNAASSTIILLREELEKVRKDCTEYLQGWIKASQKVSSRLDFVETIAGAFR